MILGITINTIRKLCYEGKIKWTTHILARIQERNINPSDVKHCIATGEIIEKYPTDYPFPSCLIVGLSEANLFLHTVVGIGNDYLWLVTAYYPSIEKWENNFKVRKVAK